MRQKNEMLKHVFALGAALVLTAAPQAHPKDDLVRPIRVSPDGHYLAQPDGQPFFWLGDIAWTLFARLTREQTEVYLQDRAGKGYNVIQAAALAGPWYGVDTPNRYGQLPLIRKNLAKPNPRYFEHIDWVVERAATHGIRIAMLPVWSITEINASDSLFDERSAYEYGRWIGARYRGKGIIWMLGGDTNPLWIDSTKKRDFVSVVDHRPVYDALAKGLTEGEGGDPFITYHPTNLSFPGTAPPRTSLYFPDRAWLDMNMLQSSHFLDPSEYLKTEHADFSWRGPYSYEPISQEYASKPVRPIIDGEPRFEDLLIDLGTSAHKGNWSGYDAGTAAYQAVFAGAAGHSYGHHSIWQFVGSAEKQSYQLAKHSKPWTEALQSPTAGQLRYLKALMLSRPYFTRIPDQSLIVGDAGEGTAHIGATRDKDRSYAMVYLPQGQTVSLDLSKISGLHVKGWWFDPRTGSATQIGDLLPRNAHTVFVPPSQGTEHDWILVLDDAAKKYPPPGTRVLAQG